MSSIWDFCFGLISDTTKRTVAPGKDFASYYDKDHHVRLVTQNLRKASSNTMQVKKDKTNYAQADIIWVFGPDGNYSYRIDVREDHSGKRTGEIYALRPTHRTLYSLPEDPDVTLDELVTRPTND